MIGVVSTTPTQRPPGAARDRVAARATYAAGVASLGLTVWIWARTGQLDPILRDPLVPNLSEAFLTGLVSSHLMVLQVVLMARLPWLERAWGRGVLTRRHRLLGYASFWLMLVHVYLFALQRVLRYPEHRGRALGQVFVSERWMLIATIGTVLIVAVVLTSIRRAVRRLRYESWHLIHLYAYVGMGLALPHQLVAADFGPLWVRAWFLLLYIGALVAVLWWRVAVPLQVSARHRIVVSSVSREGGAVSVTMAGRDLEQLGARAGDFLTWRFLTRRGALSGHPYSLSAAPTSDRLRVSVSAGQEEAARLAELRPGTRVLVEGPYGALGDLRRRHPRLLLLAAGLGITPLRALLEEVRPGAATLLYRVSDDAAGRAALGDEVTALARERDVHLVWLAGPRRSAYSWLPEDYDGDEVGVLRDLVPEVVDSDVVLCGPSEWSDRVAATLQEAGVRRRDVHREDFGWFG